MRIKNDGIHPVACPVCGKTRTQRSLEVWECSHIDCPIPRNPPQQPADFEPLFEGSYHRKVRKD